MPHASPSTLSTSVDVEAQTGSSTHGPKSPTSTHQRSSSQFRIRRQATVKASKEYQTASTGQEPGIDPDAASFTDPRLTSVQDECQITVVEFSEDNIAVTDMWNNGIQDFLDQPKPDWCKVRWINCNGLSWDVIKALAKNYHFHGLALEDVLTNHSHNRPKVDWYSDHAFIILPLLKLVDSDGPHDNHSNFPSPSDRKEKLDRKKSFWKRMVFGAKDEDQDEKDYDYGAPHKEHNVVRTLQRHHGGPNRERIEYMERNASLRPLNKVVHVEQVSIFMTQDTVVSFFEISGDDIEPPILTRLNSKKTLLRTSSDTSMMLQAIIDAIVDLSFPVIGAYQDIIAEMELTILTDPSIKISQRLYILTSELSLLKSTMAPIAGVVTALRDHKRSFLPNAKTTAGVEVTQMTRTYLADILDHENLLIDNLETMKRAADNMIDLIFNTVSSLQNESMKTLSLITVIFLPLSFLTGYFGMNFQPFPAVDEHTDTLFWKIAGPVIFVMLVWSMKEMIGRSMIKKGERRALNIAKNRRRRRQSASVRAAES